MSEVRYTCLLHDRILFTWKLYLDANYYETLEINKYNFL